MSRVSVIVPTYNRAEFLKASLAALFEQTRQPDEILVIDDGSSDDTETIAKSFDERVQFFRKPENSGKAASLNLGLQRVTGNLIWIVDDDDIALPHALETLLALLEQSPGAGFAYGRHMRFSEDSSGIRTELGTGYWQDLNPDHFLIQTLEDFFPHQPGMVVRKSLYESVGPFDVSLKRSQDYEMLIRLAQAAPCTATDDILFLQRQHDGAHGVSGDRFAAHERDAKWMAHDQKIFKALRDELALSDYLPRGDDIKGDADRRKALLQRGVIFARKKLWDLATEDFETAAQLGSDTLSDEEQAILRRTLSSKYGCDEITDDPDIFASLRKLKTIEPVGSAILDGVLRGLRWRIREALQTGKPGHALHLVQRSLSAKLAR